VLGQQEQANNDHRGTGTARDNTGQGRPAASGRQLSVLPGVQRMTSTLVMKRIAHDRPLPA